MTVKCFSVFCIWGCGCNRSYTPCLPQEKVFSEVLCIIREGVICTQRRRNPWNISGMKCLPKDKSPHSMGKQRRKKEQICEQDVWWLGYQHLWIFTDCLGTPAFKVPSAIAPSQLPGGAGAPTSVRTTTHPLKEIPGVWAPTVSILLQSLLCQRTRATSVLEAGPAVGQVFWEVEEKKKIGIVVLVLGEHPKQYQLY